MNWRLKCKLLIERGASPGAAMEKLLDEQQQQIQLMDKQLAQCVALLTEVQVREIFDITDSQNTGS